MHALPPRLRRQLSEDPLMTVCIFVLKDPEHRCYGAIEWDHVWSYANTQIQEAWAIVPVCAGWHRIKNFGFPVEKDWHRYVSLMRASEKDLKKYPRRSWLQERSYLAQKYKNMAIF